MRINKYYYLTAFFLISLAVFAAWQWRTTAQYGGKSVQLTINSDKSGYELGEIIGLNFEIANLTDNPVEIITPNVLAGNLKVYVSVDGLNFREYVGPRWGSIRIRRQTVKLQSGENYQAKATVLHNRTIAAEHLTELYRNSIIKENLDTNFAMMNSGRYFLKAVYSDGKTKLESEPLAIVISEPVGLDAAVWEKIKKNGAYAYFLQTGEVLYRSDTPQRETFVRNLEQLTVEFPNSNLVENIRTNLVKYEQTQQYLQNLKTTQINESN